MNLKRPFFFYSKTEPDKLAHYILKDLHTTKKKKTRAILRMLPVSGSCKAFMEEIPKYFETFLEPWFKDPNKATFQIVYKARNNSHMSRDDVIKALAGKCKFFLYFDWLKDCSMLSYVCIHSQSTMGNLQTSICLQTTHFWMWEEIGVPGKKHALGGRACKLHTNFQG